MVKSGHITLTSISVQVLHNVSSMYCVDLNFRLAHSAKYEKVDFM